MKVLVIGGGGREHALAWKLASSPRVHKVFVAPGNGGTASDPRFSNVPYQSNEALAQLALDQQIALTVVGPEAALASGVVDLFRARGLRIFGPTRAAAQIESSKDFAKALMRRHGIPTADYQTFTDATAAHAYVTTRGAPIVIKADGLAAGKGVVVAMTPEEAHAAIDSMLGDSNGSRVVIEEFLEGEEASFIVLSDGKNVLALASSQDHKRLLDNDQGPNTGGMGAYSPAPIVTPAVHAKVLREIISPAINGMAAEGNPFTGFLYAGLMIDTAGNVKTVEFNCRLGDPETQVILPRLKSDLVPLIEAAIDGKLDQAVVDWDRRTALGVVVAAAGYPSDPRKGDAITRLPGKHDDCITFHAGTELIGGQLVTHGGRVLCVTALGDTVRAAQKRAYDAVDEIRFDGLQYRRDIGHRALPARSHSVGTIPQLSQFQREEN
ncbi:MAG: phosphoribosylamine--glycine ligase [Burkholderiaceae bacterium]|nr:phosphoribosylamine--glycine ligase [Burkholderiaceae bacterium]